MMTTIVQLLQSNMALWVSIAAILGLVVGSFLNVVIHRLPLMMEREWTEQYQELAGEPNQNTVKEAQAPINLLTPGSQCPHCGYRIRAWENIPVISYLLLQGRCSNCQVKISVRYPIVELIAGLLSAIVAWHFGFGWQAVAAMLLSWSLIALSAIDIDHQLLPDAITLPLLWAGLTISLFPVFIESPASILGALAGYLCLWIIYHLFKLITGKEGMGYGDFKLLAALGAWMGWGALPIVVLLSSVVGAIAGITMIVVRGRDRQVPIPFGPYLAAAGWLTLLWGQLISDTYLRWARSLA
ncbi:MAG: A24 family peptidase [Gammaproteobacteria bacterium]